jgi:peptidyl-Asp metalloendopeptidase
MLGNAKFVMGVRLLGLVVLSAMLLNLGVLAAPADEGLFSEVAAADGLDLGGDPTVIRSRPVTVDLSLLGAPDASGDARSGVAGTLTLNFFSDAVFTAALDRVDIGSAGGFSWIGHLEGVELSQVTLVVRDGMMVGNVTAPGVFYRVRYAGDGVHVVQQADWAAFPPEAEPIPVTAPEGGVDRGAGALAEDDGSIIEVLVVYTDDVLAYYGGDTGLVESMIHLAVSETNAGYANSDVDQRLYLVHTAMIPYDETDFDWSLTLSRLRSHGDGYFDEVTQPGTGLRDTYCADEVVLIVTDTGYCGIAYLMSSVSHGFEDWAFAVVSRTCATGYYSFAHELGHNMGAHHDRANASGQGAFDYSYGYQAPDEAFRTVMAYNCAGGCTRVNYWSNPDVSYGGQPMGVVYTSPESADNHLTLNNTALTVANFRTSCTVHGAPSAPSPPDGDSMCGEVQSFDWSSVIGAAEYHIQVDDDPGFGSLEIDAVAADSFYEHTSSLAPGTYYWHVRGSNTPGDGPWSDVWDFTTVACDEHVYVPVTLSDGP